MDGQKKFLFMRQFCVGRRVFYEKYINILKDMVRKINFIRVKSIRYQKQNGFTFIHVKKKKRGMNCDLILIYSKFLLFLMYINIT